MKTICPSDLTPYIIELRDNEKSWDEVWVASCRVFGLNHPLFVPMHHEDSGREVSFGKFTLPKLTRVLEDELGIQGNWVQYYGAKWLRLCFEKDGDLMIAKLRFGDSTEEVPKTKY